MSALFSQWHLGEQLRGRRPNPKPGPEFRGKAVRPYMEGRDQSSLAGCLVILYYRTGTGKAGPEEKRN